MALAEIAEKLSPSLVFSLCFGAFVGDIFSLRPKAGNLAELIPILLFF